MSEGIDDRDRKNGAHLWLEMIRYRKKRERLCDQIGQFIALWATFQNLLHCLFCPNCPYFSAIIEKMSKSFIFQVKSFLGNFYRHLATFNWSHWSWVKALARPHVFTCTHVVSDLKNQISNIRQQSTQKQFVTRNLFEFTIWHANMFTQNY